MPQNGGKNTRRGNSASVIQKLKSTKEYTVMFPSHLMSQPPTSFPAKKANVTSLLTVLPEIFYTSKLI